MKKIKFARVGGLSPVIQEGYTVDSDRKTFHSPPARKGFYAFTHPYFEPFLLGGDWAKLGGGNRQEKFQYLKDKDGNRIKMYTNDFKKTDAGNRDPFFNPELVKYTVKGRQGNWSRSYDGFKELSGKYWTEPIRDEEGNCINWYIIHKKKLKIFEHTGELWHHLNNEAVKQFEIIAEVGSWIKTDYDTFVRALERNKINCVQQLMHDKMFALKQTEINTKNVYRFMSKDHLEVFIERIK